MKSLFFAFLICSSSLGHAATVLELGIAQLENGDWSSAEASFSLVINSDAALWDRLTARFGRASAREKLCNFKAAFGDYTVLIEHSPRNGECYARRSWCSMEQKNYEEAIRDASKAIALQPSNSLAFMSRALSWARLKKYDSAIADFTSAAAFKPDDLGAYLGRGIARSLSGDHTGALRDFSYVLSKDPQNAAAREWYDKELPLR